MPYLCFTADLDRDVNIPIPGRPEAGSIDRGSGTAPRFSSAGRGLHLLTDLLDELSVPAMFFAEARTLDANRDLSGCLDGFEVGIHGLDHEDFTTLDEASGRCRISSAISAIKDISGTLPDSIRFPYMRRPAWADEVLLGLGVKNDSSEYSESMFCRPRNLAPGLRELPIFGKNENGKLRSSYLWPVHEGTCSPEDFLKRFNGFPEDSVLLLSDHCWHIVEKRSTGVCEDFEGNLEDIRFIMGSLLDSGFVPIGFSEAMGLL